MHARLERVRLGAGAARGALYGTGAGILWMAVTKWWLVSWAPELAWGMPLAGALVGWVFAILRGRAVTTAEAALYLDAKWATACRFATVATREGAAIDRIAAELAIPSRLPAVPLPRVFRVVPAAVFALVVMHWLPAPTSAAPADESERLARVAVTTPGASGTTAANLPQPTDASTVDRKRMASPEHRAEMERAILSLVPRPEDRARAQRQLAAAQSGDAEAARALEEELRRILEGARDGASVHAGAIYPDEAEFLRDYRAALAKEK